MPEKHDRNTGKCLAYMLVNDVDVIDNTIPALCNREVPGVLRVPAMSPMIVRAHGKATFHSGCGKSCVTVGVFAETMYYLNDGGTVAIRLPKLGVYRVTVVNGQNLRAVMYHCKTS